MRLKKKSKGSFVGLAGCFGVLGLLAVAMLCPVQNSNVNAADDVTQNVATDTTVFVKSVVAVSLQSAADVEVIPKSNLGTSSSTAKMTVSTNNSSGYSVFMKTGDGTSNLKATDASNSAVIPAVSGEKTLANFGTTGWGYNLSTADPTPSTTFKAVPGSETQITRSENANVRDTYNLTFGAAVGTDLPAGSYSNSVVLSVVANPLTITNLTQLTYMQDMTWDICNNTSAVNTTKQLIDTRDGKSYYVTKLKDGNCWMTQNLDLDITTAGLKAADTDLITDWTNKQTGNGIVIGTKDSPTIVDVTDKDGKTTQVSVPSNSAQSADEYVPTKTQTTVPAAVSNPSQVTTYSWDFGKWVLATPTLGSSCGDVTDIAECVKVGFVNVEGWEPTFQARTLAAGESFTLPNGGPTVGAGQTIAVDSVAKTYDPHYLIGNYYQFNAATAGSGGAIADANAEASICPKGWKLPTSGTQNNTANDSFYNLLVNYGLTSSVTGSAGGVNYNIATTPLYFVRSGFIHLYGKSFFKHGGDYGEIWSTLASSKYVTGSTMPSAYYFEFKITDVYPTRGPNERWLSFPLRCLARRS